MTNDTINNVPRELLADLLGNDHDKRIMAERHLLAMLANAPSPAGVDGLKPAAMIRRKSPLGTEYACEAISYNLPNGTELCRLSDANAIIDGLRGEVAEQEETANQWRELALQFDRHRMTAMAHIRAAASGDKSAIEALGVFAALPPIPGHEITAERDQHAQRIGELEGLLLHVQVSLSLDDTEWGYSGAEKYKLLADIRAALSAGKEQQ